jgi:transcriptional regulator with GAF, ATPase, and Fis domain
LINNSPESGREDGGAAATAQDRADADYARRLRDALTGLGILGNLAVPHTQEQLLNLLVRNAMQVIHAKLGTLRLLDRAANELTFEVIEVGPGVKFGHTGVVEAARKVRVPVGEGIAGWVAATGQAVVRSHLDKDARFVAESGERLGYVPTSLLCLPLQSDDGVLGVIELFDKANGEGFTNEDMNTLGLFGAAAATAIAQSQVLGDLTKLFGLMLERMLGGASDQVLLQDRAADLVARTVSSSDYRDTIQIALTAGQIARQGPDARRFCLQTLEAFADYLRMQHNRATMGGLLS